MSTGSSEGATSVPPVQNSVFFAGMVSAVIANIVGFVSKKLPVSEEGFAMMNIFVLMVSVVVSSKLTWRNQNEPSCYALTTFDLKSLMSYQII